MTPMKCRNYFLDGTLLKRHDEARCRYVHPSSPSWHNAGIVSHVTYYRNAAELRQSRGYPPFNSLPPPKDAPRGPRNAVIQNNDEMFNSSAWSTSSNSSRRDPDPATASSSSSHEGWQSRRKASRARWDQLPSQEGEFRSEQSKALVSTWGESSGSGGGWGAASPRGAATGGSSGDGWGASTTWGDWSGSSSGWGATSTRDATAGTGSGEGWGSSATWDDQGGSSSGWDAASPRVKCVDVGSRAGRGTSDSRWSVTEISSAKGSGAEWEPSKKAAKPIEDTEARPKVTSDEPPPLSASIEPESPTVIFSRPSATVNDAQPARPHLGGDVVERDAYLTLVSALSCAVSSRQELDRCAEENKKFLKVIQPNEYYTTLPSPLQAKLSEKQEKLKMEMEEAKHDYRRQLKALCDLPYNHSGILFADFDDGKVEKVTVGYTKELQCWIDDISKSSSLYPPALKDGTSTLEAPSNGLPPLSLEQQLRDRLEQLIVEIGDLRNNLAQDPMQQRENHIQLLLKPMFDDLEEGEQVTISNLEKELGELENWAKDLSAEIPKVAINSAKTETVRVSLAEEHERLQKQRDELRAQVAELERQEAEDRNRQELLTQALEGLQAAKQKQGNTAAIQASIPLLAPIVQAFAEDRMREAREAIVANVRVKMEEHRAKVVQQVDEKILSEVTSLSEFIGSS